MKIVKSSIIFPRHLFRDTDQIPEIMEHVLVQLQEEGLNHHPVYIHCLCDTGVMCYQGKIMSCAKIIYMLNKWQTNFQDLTLPWRDVESIWTSRELFGILAQVPILRLLLSGAHWKIFDFSTKFYWKYFFFLSGIEEQDLTTIISDIFKAIKTLQHVWKSKRKRESLKYSFLPG